MRSQSNVRDADLHGATLPTAIATRRIKEIGIANLLKNGAPTPAVSPVTASRNSGYNVPSSTMNANTLSKRLFTMKNPSRLTIESSRGDDEMSLILAANTPNETTSTKARNHRRTGPIGDCEKL